MPILSTNNQYVPQVQRRVKPSITLILTPRKFVKPKMCQNDPFRTTYLKFYHILLELGATKHSIIL